MLPTGSEPTGARRRVHAPAHEKASRHGALWEEAKTLVKRGRGLLVHDDTPRWTSLTPLAKWSWCTLTGAANIGGGGFGHQPECAALDGWGGICAHRLSSLRQAPGRAHQERAFPGDVEERQEERQGAGIRTAVCVVRLLPYSALETLENLKAIRSHHWRWLCRLKSNRLVNPDKEGNVTIKEVAIPFKGRVVHLKAEGLRRHGEGVSDGGQEGR